MAILASVRAWIGETRRRRRQRYAEKRGFATPEELEAARQDLATFGAAADRAYVQQFNSDDKPRR